jgi:hypothetical protein
MFYYHNIIYVGIVQFDVYPTNSPSNKQHHQGEPFAVRRHGLSELAHPTPGGLFGRGRLRLW